MTDLGDPTSYLELADGVPVLSADGEEIGTVAHVLSDAASDIFDGLVIDTRLGHRFVDAAEIEGLYVNGAVLTLDAAAVERLPQPSENPAADADDSIADDLSGKLKRAWNRISGR